MPEFNLDRGTPESVAVFEALDIFTQAYIEAAFWTENETLTDTGDRGDRSGNWEPKLDITFADLDPDTLKTMIYDCAKFQAQMDGAVSAAGKHESMQLRGSVEDEWAQAGHDFWLTRNGHGAGFWDGDWPEPYATQLTDASKAFGEFSLYLGDDGRIYS